MEPIDSRVGSYSPVHEQQEEPPLAFLQELLKGFSLELVEKPLYLKRLYRLIPKEEAPAYAEILVRYLIRIGDFQNPNYLKALEESGSALNDNIPLFDALQQSICKKLSVPRAPYLTTVLINAIEKKWEKITQYLLDNPDLVFEERLFECTCRYAEGKLLEDILERFLKQVSRDEIFRFFATTLSLLTRDRTLSLLNLLEKQGFDFTAQLQDCKQPELLSLVPDLKLLDYFLQRLDGEKLGTILQKISAPFLFKALERQDVLQNLDEAFEYLQNRGISLQDAFLERNAEGRRLLDQACRLHLPGCPEWIIERMTPETLHKVLAKQDFPYLSTYEHCLDNTSEDNFALGLLHAQLIEGLQVSLSM